MWMMMNNIVVTRFSYYAQLSIADLIRICFVDMRIKHTHNAIYILLPVSKLHDLREKHI